MHQENLVPVSEKLFPATPEPVQLDAYLTRSCPLRSLYKYHPGYRDFESPNNPPKFFDALAALETEVFGALLAVPGAVDASGLTSVEVLELLGKVEPPVVIHAAIQAGPAEGIIDILIYQGRNSAGLPAYRPAEIKCRNMAFHTNDDADSITISPLTEPRRIVALSGWQAKWHRRVPDLTHLAHDWNLLAAHGLVPDGEAIAGVIDSAGERVIWFDLCAPGLPVAPMVEMEAEHPPVSALERYREDFDYRIGLARRAAAAPETAEPELRPVMLRECENCGWWPICDERLASDDISRRVVNGRFDFWETVVLRELGILTIEDLANVDLERFKELYLPRVQHRDGAESRLETAYRRARMFVADVMLERTTSGPIEVPSAPVEIDLDIETDGNGRVYLWGFWVDENAGRAHGRATERLAVGRQPDDAKLSRPYFQEFSSFTDLDEVAEVNLAEAAMTWLREFIGEREALVYHYSPYERSNIDRLSKQLRGTGRHVPALKWASRRGDLFCDLLPIVRANFFGREGVGLKIMASYGAGFHWRDPDPSGLNSIAWADEAVHAEDFDTREAARIRVLEYNEDDVRATWELRRWLRSLV